MVEKIVVRSTNITQMAEIKLDFFCNYSKVLKIITGGVIKTLSSLVTSVEAFKS